MCAPAPSTDWLWPATCSKNPATNLRHKLQAVHLRRGYLLMRRLISNAELSPAVTQENAASVLAKGGVGQSTKHESANKHVRGAAEYVDDLPLMPGTLFVATGQSTKAHANIIALDLTAVKTAPGVVDVIVQSDIPGKVDVAPVYSGDPLLAGARVEFIGQPIFAVAAT